MATAIFGIDNDGLSLVVNLFALMLVVIWLALVVYTYLDAKRRISDPFLVGCATLGAFIPYVGTAVYAIVRPPEYLEDARERALEIKAAELRVRQLKELSCQGCGYPIEKTFLRCPRCQRRLKDPCRSCGKPVDPRWSLCPYCEAPVAGGKPSSEREPRRRQRAAEERRVKRPAERPKGGPEAASPEPRESPKQNPPQRSSSRESNPDPRQA